jgi:tRNA dimethylallyltransferase
LEKINPKDNWIPVIIGPTCSGKTYLSLQLAGMINSEIISADSRQVYKNLNIGTAKPDAAKLNKIKHHFVSMLDPREDFNASIFELQANAVIKALLDKNIIPIIIGGSGLYIKAIIDGISESADTNIKIREELLELRNNFGNDYLYNELKKIDFEVAKKMLPQNYKRVIRALEVYKLTGKSILNHHSEQKKNTNYNFWQIGLLWDRKILYQNIDNRVDEMIERGLVNEVMELLSLGFPKSLNALNTVGYKEIIEYLENKISLERAIELIKRNSRRYAKRQLTWFNADNRIEWIKIESKADLTILAKTIAKEINERKN